MFTIVMPPHSSNYSRWRIGYGSYYHWSPWLLHKNTNWKTSCFHWIMAVALICFFYKTWQPLENKRHLTNTFVNLVLWQLTQLCLNSGQRSALLKRRVVGSWYFNIDSKLSYIHIVSTDPRQELIFFSWFVWGSKNPTAYKNRHHIIPIEFSLCLRMSVLFALIHDHFCVSPGWARMILCWQSSSPLLSLWLG